MSDDSLQSRFNFERPNLTYLNYYNNGIIIRCDDIDWGSRQLKGYVQTYLFIEFL
jgi:hypothetical protein